MAHSVSKSLGHLAPLSFSMEQAYQFFYSMLYAPCPLLQMTGKANDDKIGSGYLKVRRQRNRSKKEQLKCK
jgi:hypothetical protein